MSKIRNVMVGILVLWGTAAYPRGSDARHVIHAVNSISHYYDFFSDWGFPGQYLNDGNDKYATSWCCLYNADLSNANLLFLLNCDDRLPYLQKDFQKMDEFLGDGGGIVVLSKGTSVEQNKLAKRYDAEFISGIEQPVKSKAAAQTLVLKPDGQCHLAFANPSNWTVVAEDATGQAVLAYTKVKRGYLMVGSRALLSDNPDLPDAINRLFWHHLWHQIASEKRVSPTHAFKNQYIEALENNIRRNGLDIYFNDYLRSYADSMFSISNRCMPEMQKVIGVPLSKGMASKIILLPTADGGVFVR